MLTLLKFYLPLSTTNLYYAAITKQQSELLKQRVLQSFDDNIRLSFAMRYGQPSIESELNKLLNEGVEKILILPLYPQYSQTTTESTFDIVNDWIMSLVTLVTFY